MSAGDEASLISRLQQHVDFFERVADGRSTLFADNPVGAKMLAEDLREALAALEEQGGQFTDAQRVPHSDYGIALHAFPLSNEHTRMTLPMTLDAEIVPQ